MKTRKFCRQHKWIILSFYLPATGLLWLKSMDLYYKAAKELSPWLNPDNYGFVVLISSLIVTGSYFLFNWGIKEEVLDLTEKEKTHVEKSILQEKNNKLKKDLEEMKRDRDYYKKMSKMDRH